MPVEPDQPQATRWRQALILLAAGLLVCQTAVLRAESFDNTLPAELADMGVTEHLAEALPLDLKFRDETGRTVSLKEFFGAGRPVILSFNYSNCPMLCNLQLSGLVTGLQNVELSCGKDFEFVSVSIDPNEQPFRAAQTRQRYYQLYQREGTGSGWHFLVGDQVSISTLAKAVGMTYRYLKDKNEYVHPALCVAVTPDGRLSRYLYGVTFDPQTLRLGLVEASQGGIGSTLDQILLFCFHYDNVSGRYSIAARKLMSAGGTVTAMGLGLFLFSQFRREKHKLALSQSPNVA